MDLGLSGVPSQSALAVEPASKRIAVGARSSGSDPELKKMMLTISKLLMNVEWQCRCYRAILIDTFRVPKDEAIVVQMKETTAKLYQESKRLRDSGMDNLAVKSRLGPPHIHAFNSSLKVLGEALVSKGKAQEKQQLDLWCSEWGPRGVKGLTPFVRHWATSKMYDKDYVKLELNVVEGKFEEGFLPTEGRGPSWVLGLVRSHILAIPGALEMPGQAPKGDLAQKVQKWIDSQNE